MSATRSINLNGKIRQIGRVTFLRAELGQERESQFATIFYAVDGQEQPLGLRLDVTKKALLDLTGDETADGACEEVTNLILRAIQTGATPIAVGSAPHDVDLDKPFEFEGVFWLPQETVQQSRGVISYTPDDGLKLRLATPLEAASGHGLLGGLGGPYGSIFGRLSGGGIVTLLDTFVTSKSFGLGGLGSLEVFANRCIFGVHLVSSTDVAFTGFTLELTSLEEWLGIWAIANERKINEEGQNVTVVTFTSPPVQRIHVPAESLTITINLGLSENHEAFRTVTLAQRAWIHVTSEAERDISEWMSISYRLQNLFSLFVGKGVTVRQLSLELAGRVIPEGSFNTECPVAFMRRDARARERLHPSEMVIAFFNIENQLASVVERWFALSSTHQQAINMFLGGTFYSKLPLESRFVAALSALEVYHRDLGINQLLDTSTFGQLVEVLANDPALGVDDQKRDMLRQNLQRANDYPMTERIREMVARFPGEFGDALQVGKPEFAKRIVDQRDHIVHGVAEHAPEFSPPDLFRVTDRLRMLLCAVLLSDMGIDPALAAARVRATREFQWAIHQPIA
jgi:hypothetical protein